MRILFVGAFRNKWSTHHPMVQALKKQNHQVIKFDFREIPKKYIKITSSLYTIRFKKYFNLIVNTRFFLPNRIRSIKYFLFGNWAMNRQLLRMIKKNTFDLVFLAKTEIVNYNLIPKINKFTKTWYYFMDPLKVSNEINAHKYAKFATWSSSSTTTMDLLFRKSGANSFYITQGINSEIYNLNNQKEEKDIDVLFIGTKNQKREKYISFLLKNEVKVVCYGPGWPYKPIYLDDVVQKYKRAKIVLNFHRDDAGFSIRVFEVMATGAFLLSEYCSDLKRIFNKGIHMDWFNSPEECLQLINYYLEHDGKREQIATVGYNYVINKYTWDSLLKKITQIVNNEGD